METIDTKHDSKTKLLNAALHVIRAKGYTATRIEDICETAGLTKGSFVHHFKSKEDLALEAAEHWSVVTGGLFAAAPYRTLSDPLDRLLGYIDFRKAILQGEVSQFTCLIGTMVQEIYDTHPHLREACDKSISDHAARVQADIAEAMQQYGIHAEWTAESLALYTQAVLQGSFVLAKAKGGPEIAASCIDHLRGYIELLFTHTNPRRTPHDDHPAAVHRDPASAS
jgi:TetR/AcrR family transcriptional regulator, transcriptional repressor for nem operon